MTVREIYNFMNELAPLELALDWDNSGLQIGDMDASANKVYLCLDATEEAIDEAAALGAELIISHHPMIFSPVKNIRADDFIGRRILKLAASGISYMAMHTNFDVAAMPQAVNERLQLQHTEVLEITSRDAAGNPLGIGYIGTLQKPLKLSELDGYVTEMLGFETAGYYGDPGAEVSRVAVCPGSGSSVVGETIGRADVLITGDIGHHTGIDATARGLSIINAGHYEVEHVFISYVERKLREAFPELAIYPQESKAPLHH